jgi:hypothetical protein
MHWISMTIFPDGVLNMRDVDFSGLFSAGLVCGALGAGLTVAVVLLIRWIS